MVHESAKTASKTVARDAERQGQASEQTIMAIAGHLSRAMLEHYSHIRMAAKRAALDAIASKQAVVLPVVRRNVHRQRDNQKGQVSNSLK
jgi:hypothetical protein